MKTYCVEVSRPVYETASFVVEAETEEAAIEAALDRSLYDSDACWESGEGGEHHAFAIAEIEPNGREDYKRLPNPYVRIWRETLTNALDALRDMCNAAGNGQPYQAHELETFLVALGAAEREL